MPTPSAIKFEIPSIDQALPYQGLQRGAIHEFFYNDPLEPKAIASTIPALLAYNSHTARTTLSKRSKWRRDATPLHRTLWIGKRSWPAPPAIAALTAGQHTAGQHTAGQQAISESFFNHSVFIDPPNDATILWAIDLALRSSAVDLIIAACPSISRTTTQRLSLAAQKNGTTAILLRAFKDLTIPSSASSRWTISPTRSNNSTPSWKLSLTKLRGGLLLNGEWIVSIATPNLFEKPLQQLSAERISLSDSAQDLNRERKLALP
jgi:hypothetical protein